MKNKSWEGNSKLVIAISSRALFDLDDEHAVFINDGKEAYSKYQIEHEDEILKPGYGFSLVEKLLNINKSFEGEGPIEILMISRNSADTGLRAFKSIQHYGLDIKRAAFTGGASRHEYLEAFGAHLFLSADGEDVRNALEAGYPAATIVSGSNDKKSDQVRIGFDADACLFDDSSERLFIENGLSYFVKHEKDNAHNPLPKGPLAVFANAISQIQKRFDDDESPIRTALITARAAPAHERVVRTLREWGVRIDEAIFLGGVEKGPFLEALKVDLFIDDSIQNINSAVNHQVTAAHIPHGIKNELPVSKKGG